MTKGATPHSTKICNLTLILNFIPMNNRLSLLKSNTSGFTFVELLVVIVIMAVLIAASANYLFSTGGAKARDVERKNEMKQVAALLEEFVSSFGSPPNPNLPTTTNRIKNALTDPNKCKVANSGDNWDALIACLVEAGSIGGDGAVKLKEDPKEDAKNDQDKTYRYYYKAGQTVWKVCALLENQKDPDINDDGNGNANPAEGSGLYCLVTMNKELNHKDVTFSL